MTECKSRTGINNAAGMPVRLAMLTYDQRCGSQLQDACYVTLSVEVIRTPLKHENRVSAISNNARNTEPVRVRLAAVHRHSGSISFSPQRCSALLSDWLEGVDEFPVTVAQVYVNALGVGAYKKKLQSCNCSFF